MRGRRPKPKQACSYTEMSLTHYLLNDYTPVERFFEDMMGGRAYRQSQQADAFRPRWALLEAISYLSVNEQFTIIT